MYWSQIDTYAPKLGPYNAIALGIASELAEFCCLGHAGSLAAFLGLQVGRYGRPSVWWAVRPLSIFNSIESKGANMGVFENWKSASVITSVHFCYFRVFWQPAVAQPSNCSDRCSYETLVFRHRIAHQRSTLGDSADNWSSCLIGLPGSLFSLRGVGLT